MKLIVAIIRHYHLEYVQPALERHGWYLTSVTQVVGSANGPGYTLIYREREIKVSRPKLRLELTVDAWDVEPAVEVIRAATAPGCPGNVSDAKIMVLSIDEIDAPRDCEPSAAPAGNGLRGRQVAAVSH